MDNKNDIKNKIFLAPIPEKCEIDNDQFFVNEGGEFAVLLDSNGIYENVKIALSLSKSNIKPLFYVEKALGGAFATFTCDKKLGSEAYTLTVKKDVGVNVTYGDEKGAFYAAITLLQIVKQCDKKIPEMTIEDKPYFKNRGYMLDIGRNKVPKLSEMEKLVDFLAFLKINHLELYIEGIPFEYPSFPKMWKGFDVLKGEDILELDSYCKARNIELVPTQNNFGHMDKWLLKEYRDLAECPNGFHFDNSFLPDPRCLNPFDPRSEELVNKLADDILPYFSSDKYNICCDETLELGQGASKEACEKLGKGRVYIDFLKKVQAAAKRHGKSTLFWDDIIRDFPELLAELPKDSVALEWGYLSNEPYEKNCEMMEKLGVRYYTCPGTGAWNTLLGKTSQMKANIANAAIFGKRHGAEGLLNTDWGDCGHLQSIATSYSGIVYGAAMAWNVDENLNMDLAGVLNNLVFEDKAGIMGQLVLDAGDYFLVEPTIPNNITYSFLMLLTGFGRLDDYRKYTVGQFEKVENYLDEVSARLDKVDLQRDDADLILREYKLAFCVIKTMQILGKYAKASEAGDKDKCIEYLTTIRDNMKFCLEEQRSCWLIRNKYSYLDDSVGVYKGMINAAEAALAELGEKV